MVLCLTVFNIGTALASVAHYPHVRKSVYRKAFKKWTKSDELYQREDFYASMAWHVTYLSPGFLSTLVDEVARIYDYSPAETDKYRREVMQKFGDNSVFFVSFYGYDYKASDISKKDSVWKLRLETADSRDEPEKIELIKKPDPLLTQLYNYIRPWARHYYVYFPQVDAPTVKLKVNGPHSQGELTW